MCFGKSSSAERETAADQDAAPSGGLEDNDSTLATSKSKKATEKGAVSRSIAPVARGTMSRSLFTRISDSIQSRLT
jgi:hypothetical protein